MKELRKKANNLNASKFKDQKRDWYCIQALLPGIVTQVIETGWYTNLKSKLHQLQQYTKLRQLHQTTLN